MPLKLSAADGSYLWPVNVDVPIDGGRFDKFSFEARFRRVPQARAEELVLLAVKNAQALQLGRDPEADGNDRAVAAEVLTGWAGVLDDDGNEIAYTPSNVSALLDFPGAAGAIAQAWFESINGKRAKN